MCLAIPMKLVKRVDALGIVELDGIQREISLMLQPEVSLGDFVLVHAGYAIGVVDADEARATIEMLREMGGFEEALG